MDIWDIFIIIGIGLGVFLITFLIYPQLIKYLKKKNYIGYDIHKHARPATPESGGLGLTIGMIIGFIIIGIVYPLLWKEALIIIITVGIAALIGWIDDRKTLSSYKKMALMFATGIPIFVANFYGIKFINVQGPILPILGRLQLTIIYPIVLPIIIMIMTNTVNMLEGYNGEGSGTTGIATFFMVICAIIIKSADGITFGIVILASIGAFFLFNKFPAKAFPGDIGTLAIGAAIGIMGIFGSLEVIMLIVMIPQVFNSFYTLASVHGFKESHNIEKKDIWIDNEDIIHASDEHGAPLTLPRLILAYGNLNEKNLVNNFMAFSFISGLSAIIMAMLMEGLEISSLLVFIGITIVCVFLIILTVLKFPQIKGLSILMSIIFCVALSLIWIIDLFIIDLSSYVNWLYGGLIGLVILAFWYFATLKHFWITIEKMKNKPDFISFEEMQKQKDIKA
ncbi:MAG: hypothetical protein ACTSVL_04270 [Promethearchaeota archaeon]